MSTPPWHLTRQTSGRHQVHNGEPLVWCLPAVYAHGLADPPVPPTLIWRLLVVESSEKPSEAFRNKQIHVAGGRGGLVSVMWREIVETMGDDNIGWSVGRGDGRTVEPVIKLWATSAVFLRTGRDAAAAGANSCCPSAPPSLRTSPAPSPPYNYSGVIVALHPHLLLSAY